MAHSYAEQADVSCPGCGHKFEAETWLIVDTAERPDLLDRIRDGTLHDVACPHCGQQVGRTDAPLLVFRPDAATHILFLHAQRTTPQQDKEALGGLLRRLRESLGTEWRNEWVEKALRDELGDMLPAVLSDTPGAVWPEVEVNAGGDGVAEGRALLNQFVGASTWEESQRIVEEHPELLSDETAALFDELIETQADENAARVLAEHRDLLRRCREAGIPRAFAEKMLPPEVLARAEAAGMSPEEALEMARAAEEMPPELREVLAELAASGIEIRTQEDLEAALAERPELRAKLEAAAQAMDNDESKAPPELGSILQELGQPARRTDMARRAQLCRQALTLLVRDQNPHLWAALQGELGNSLAQSLSGDRAQNLEEAIAAYRQALEVMTRQAMPVEWAKVMMNLANAYQIRIRGDRAQNLEEAIAAYRQALEVHDPPGHARRVGDRHDEPGDAYSDRIRGDRAQNLEEAIAAYRQALEVLTRQAMPVEWATVMMNLATAYY